MAFILKKVANVKFRTGDFPTFNYRYISCYSHPPWEFDTTDDRKKAYIFDGEDDDIEHLLDVFTKENIDDI